ncbi:MAG: sulfotransferase family 2 domain-containing protein, partial [Planctomycetaceae bacterium]|nr:sulfotransferase family 2 domain-containing protein [Planctomycetaceae bacterium]
MKNSVFFLHIPKTAGTTINKVFRPLFKESRFFDHCESRNPELIQELKVAKEPFFASGHLRFAKCAGIIADPEIFSLTVLRDPDQHIQSHLNWVRAYGAPEAAARRRMIDPAIAELSLRLWDVEFNDICEMEKL